MFRSNIGRGRFFAYSVALIVGEGVAVLIGIAATIGFEGLANSKPGPGREGLALAMLVISMVFVVLRANFAWRRTRDAQGPKWVLGGYVVLSFFFALLQSATFLVYKFGGDNSNIGLNILGLSVTGLWATILVARPARGPADSAGDAGPAPRRGPQAETMVPARVSAATNRAGGPVAARPGGFGKRGVA